jgi:hypothetical protein
MPSIRFFLFMISNVCIVLSYKKNAKLIFWIAGPTLISKLIFLFDEKGIIYFEDEKVRETQF